MNGRRLLSQYLLIAVDFNALLYLKEIPYNQLDFPILISLTTIIRYP